MTRSHQGGRLWIVGYCTHQLQGVGKPLQSAIITPGHRIPDTVSNALENAAEKPPI